MSRASSGSIVKYVPYIRQNTLRIRKQSDILMKIKDNFILRKVADLLSLITNYQTLCFPAGRDLIRLI